MPRVKHKTALAGLLLFAAAIVWGLYVSSKLFPAYDEKGPKPTVKREPVYSGDELVGWLDLYKAGGAGWLNTYRRS